MAPPAPSWKQEMTAEAVETPVVETPAVEAPVVENAPEGEKPTE
jgi:hypothetical protein